MSKYFKISGYWKDNKEEEFNDYIVKEYDDVEEDEQRDSGIFHYGLSEKALNEAIRLGEDTYFDFVVTSFDETKYL